ncbi:MAG: gluconeogenesis factor YvcK family protein [Dehalococcoidia bacterium]
MDRDRTATPPRAACLGGGNGVGVVARGLIDRGVIAAALVATSDNGRSTGLVRRLFDIPAPGDVRNVLSAFAGDPALRDLFEYRLTTPEIPALTGAAFGNLILGVLSKTSGSFEEAVAIAARLLDVRIEVRPLTVANVALCAELEDGRHVRGEVEVRAPGKAPIRRVYLDPPGPAATPALDLLAGADLITIGPGSLFTSVLACLAVDGVPAALTASSALRVYVANTTTQPGQSDDLPLTAQIEHVLAAASDAIDVVLIDASQPDPALLERHQSAGRQRLRLSGPEREWCQSRGLRIVEADLAESAAAPRDLWQKEDAIRHDAAKLGAVLLELLATREAR